eukprot:3539354-Rhodomonas_salina.1
MQRTYRMMRTGTVLPYCAVSALYAVQYWYRHHFGNVRYCPRARCCAMSDADSVICWQVGGDGVEDAAAAAH